MTVPPACRSCGASRLETFLSLGKTPLADALVRPEDAHEPEPTYSVDLAFCHSCALVQLLQVLPESVLFPETYPYFTGHSQTMRAHTRSLVEALVSSQGLSQESLVVEIGCNDGTLLEHVVSRGIPAVGVEPAPRQAAVARGKGIQVLEAFFSSSASERIVASHGRADAIVATNVLAHVPCLPDVLKGISALLRPGGVAVIENPYVRDLVERCEFDTIFHEHLYYYSCTSLLHALQPHGLTIAGFEYRPKLHGGTMSWSVSHGVAVSPDVERLLREEQDGVGTFGYFEGFGRAVAAAKKDLRNLLGSMRSEGAKIAAYAAAAKGAALLNYCEINRSTIDYVVDRNPYKQGLLLPGSHIPVEPPEKLVEDQPDAVLMLAWNLEREIVQQEQEYLRRGGKFIIPGSPPRIVSLGKGA